MDRGSEGTLLAVGDEQSDARFRAAARAIGYDPDEPWVGGYVERQWRRERLLLRPHVEHARGQPALEFGCNVGGTSIVLAALGASVTAVDVDPRLVTLTQANADRYGFAEQVRAQHVADTRSLPFPDETFGLVTMCSVIEYVPASIRRDVLAEMDRVLRPGGRVVIASTSNRLWPREVHSGRWLVNWMPRRFDRLLRRGESPDEEYQRGTFPWEVLSALRGYRNVDRADREASYLHAKRASGTGTAKISVFRLASAVLRPLGLTAGLLAPSFCVTLEKPR